MKVADILALASVPTASPPYPRGPNRFVQREHLAITHGSGIVIPALTGDRRVNFTAQMSLGDEPPIAGGRPAGARCARRNAFIADLTLPCGRVLHDHLAH